MPTGLLFELTQPMIKLDRDSIKTNILTLFEEDLTKYVALDLNKSFQIFDIVTYILTQPSP